ncbi:MAG TPA: hypothetical protein VFA54_11885 [Bryobacterales bacterium]|nr:hypothetical protein [Bryobacterales bacterium]
MPETVVEADFVNLRGVHRLAGAILVQAIEDIRCGSGRRREDAIRWVTDSNEDQFSFVFCCRILGRDPEEVRRFLVRQRIPDWLFSARLAEVDTAST